MYRAPSLACAAAVAARQPLAAEEPLADSQIEATAVNMANTVYMVNPAGDLSCTQATFEETFRQQQTWQVLIPVFVVSLPCFLLHSTASD